MLEILKTQQSHANYSTSAMEAETIQKTRESRKIHKSKRNIVMMVCFALLAVFSGCEKNNGNNYFTHHNDSWVLACHSDDSERHT